MTTKVEVTIGDKVIEKLISEDSSTKVSFIS